MPPLRAYAAAIEPLDTFRAGLRAEVAESEAFGDWRWEIGNPLDERDINRLTSELRAHCREIGEQGHALAALLPARGRFSLDLPGSQIVINR